MQLTNTLTILGCKIAKYLESRLGCPACPNLTHQKRFRCKLLVSPFRRTRETASLLLKTDLAAWITGIALLSPTLRLLCIASLICLINYLILCPFRRCWGVVPPGRAGLGDVWRHRTRQRENTVRERIRALAGHTEINATRVAIRSIAVFSPVQSTLIAQRRCYSLLLTDRINRILLQTQKLHRGKFWARMPLGESAFDVCQRVVSLFGSIRQVR